jgi:hypothetical protein
LRNSIYTVSHRGASLTTWDQPGCWKRWGCSSRDDCATGTSSGGGGGIRCFSPYWTVSGEHNDRPARHPPSGSVGEGAPCAPHIASPDPGMPLTNRRGGRVSPRPAFPPTGESTMSGCRHRGRSLFFLRRGVQTRYEVFWSDGPRADPRASSGDLGCLARACLLTMPGFLPSQE